MLKLVTGATNRGPWWPKRSACLLAEHRCQSFSQSKAANPMLCVIFFPCWEDCFFHQGQRQVTNWAASLQIPLRRLGRAPSLAILPNQPSSHKPTHLWPCTGTQTDKLRPPTAEHRPIPAPNVKSLPYLGVHTEWASPCWAAALRRHGDKQPWSPVSLSQGGFHTIINIAWTSYSLNP